MKQEGRNMKQEYMKQEYMKVEYRDIGIYESFARGVYLSRHPTGASGWNGLLAVQCEIGNHRKRTRNQ